MQILIILSVYLTVELCNLCGYVCKFFSGRADVFIDNSDLIWFLMQKEKPLFIDDAYNLQHVNDYISDYYRNVKVPSFFFFLCSKALNL